jgi:hypothetical protein
MAAAPSRCPSPRPEGISDEVNKAFAEERRREQLLLFPVRVDEAVMATSVAWARKLRDQRNIGDFRKWKDHDAYQKALERLLRDLTVCATISEVQQCG